jgi:hypothetical protein
MKSFLIIIASSLFLLSCKKENPLKDNSLPPVKTQGNFIPVTVSIQSICDSVRVSFIGNNGQGTFSVSNENGLTTIDTLLIPKNGTYTIKAETIAPRCSSCQIYLQDDAGNSVMFFTPNDYGILSTSAKLRNLYTVFPLCE